MLFRSTSVQLLTRSIVRELSSSQLYSAGGGDAVLSVLTQFISNR